MEQLLEGGIQKCKGERSEGHSGAQNWIIMKIKRIAYSCVSHMVDLFEVSWDLCLKRQV